MCYSPESKTKTEQRQFQQKRSELELIGVRRKRRLVVDKASGEGLSREKVENGTIVVRKTLLGRTE